MPDNKWVDTTKYFGPDRRRRSGKKLWNERRSLDEAGKLPPLGAMLRRLRVQMMGMQSVDDHRHALQLLAAAIIEADRMQVRACADALRAADHLLRTNGPRAANAADAHLSAAVDHLAQGR